MPRKSLFLAAVALLAVSCNDDRLPTAPQAVAPATINASVEASAPAGGSSTICMVNRKALADLDGQVQDNPDNEQLRAEFEVQSAITADVCD